MLARVITFAVDGVDAQRVWVEADIRVGLPAFTVVGLAGMASLVLGAYLAMFQQDLKGLLAYSTISHLGLITLLLSLGSPLATVAAIFHMLNHATFKASLFMAADIAETCRPPFDYSCSNTIALTIAG